MNEKDTKHILSIMVDNEPGVLARVVGLFSGRGYNIESLSVSEVDSHKFLSRITIVTSGTKLIIDQIKAQLGKLIPVHNLVDISELDSFIGRELILVKLNVNFFFERYRFDKIGNRNAAFGKVGMKDIKVTNTNEVANKLGFVLDQKDVASVGV